MAMQRATTGSCSASALEGGVGSPLRRRGRVLTVLFFFPRGGSAQVARAFAGALPAAGWQTTLVAGSLGCQGEETNAGSFFSGLEVHAVDYTPALELPDPLAALLPFQASYEERPGAPDRVFEIGRAHV